MSTGTSSRASVCGRWATPLALLATALLLAACSHGGSDDRATADQLANETPVESLAGVDLGALAPDTSTFCQAVASAPVRWITDAVIPLQYWIDSYAAVSEVPAETEGALDRLRAFADERMAWHLGSRNERPLWGDAQVDDSLLLADAAITSCPDLPLVIGLPGTSATPLAWADLDAPAVAERCARDLLRVEAAVAEFVDIFGRQPRHQIEMEPALATFYASDWHGVTVGTGGQAEVLAVPGGACDLDET